MKILKFLFIGILFIVWGCEENYIDDISSVEPGADESAPVVTIKYPLEGAEIKVLEPITSITFEFDVTDDIEVADIKLFLNGSEIAVLNEFKDYRRVEATYQYDELTTGNHVLTVTATDNDGKSTSKEVNFVKSPPYTPIHDGEIFYMPFDGDYMDLVSITNATRVGNPGFSEDKVLGVSSYAGATESYLTFPAEGLISDEFSATFWMKINATPDRAGILVIGPPDAANPEAQNVRTNGFRFFREAAGNMQRFKLNVGTGDDEAWFDGGDAADVDPSNNEWVHLAFTIAQTEAKVYINGQIVSQGTFDGIDWSNSDILSIMSGAPRFSGWDHLSDESLMDELRLFNKALTQQEIENVIGTDIAGQYEPKYDGEVLYMPFEESVRDWISSTEATIVGDPGFTTEAVSGDNAYAGAADSYLTFPAQELLSDEFSASFWMNINADPDRAGILVIGPPDEVNPEAMNNRTSGFRFFRENADGAQRFKLNVGTGETDVWFDGGANADVDPETSDWVHFAFTISQTEAKVYINGTVVSENTFDGIDWTGCDILSIMSGAPRFSEWGHLSDLSFMDELRLFNKVLSQSEIETIINDAP